MKPLQIVGLTLGAAISGMLILFIGGEMLTDPGGVDGVLLVLAWLTLPIVLAVLAWFRPTVAYPILVGVVSLVLLSAALGIVFADQFWAFENTHGPIDLMVFLGALVPLIALGRGMPERAGWLLLVTIVGTLVLHGISLILIGEPSVILVFLVLSLPFVGSAVLFIIAGRQSVAAEPAAAPAEVAPPTPAGR